ncbi:unnamed protein product [Cyclocybe aegerita]|uniref:Uncharacterized protein n=1 Tax=Cyclocybe aegerita TaxID=1973307 RepID=A0A8S0X9L1_CYCAE|nr:unnamed protein product [Cyclocybe aegerita]CAA7271443.1 unnamed protein product [Cyclocybe aegerita]
MGNPSFLRLVPASCATVPIDWAKIPEASRKFFFESWCTDWSDPDKKKRPLPATIDDLAKMFDESKFFGYMPPELCTLLLDISEFGLAAEANTRANGHALQVAPRFYMKYLYHVWFVLFLPGRRDGIIGCSAKLHVAMPGEEDEAEVANDKAVAEEYDPRLCEEVKRCGTLRAKFMKKAAGWEALTLKRNLEETQLVEATMELPDDHPVYRALVQNVMSSLRPMR